MKVRARYWSTFWKRWEQKEYNTYGAYLRSRRALRKKGIKLRLISSKHYRRY